MPTDRPQSWWRRPWSLLTQWFRRKPDASTAAQADDRALVFSLSPKRIPSLRQFRYIPRLLNQGERRSIRLITTIIFLSALTLLGHFLYRHLARTPANGGTLTEGIVGTPQYLNPVLARPFTADTDVTRLLFRGLLRVDDHLSIVPDLAESLTVSADGKTYTATLKKDQHWSDGQPITANDVRYTYETVADPSYQSPIQSLYKNLAVAAPDNRTVVFTLAEPFEPFRSSLTLGILPAELWQDQTPQTFSLAELNVKPVGSGPYKFQSVTKDRSGAIRGLSFVRNKFYNGQAPHIDRVNIKLYADTASALDALQTDAIDSFGGIETDSLAKIRKDRSLTKFSLAQLTGAFFNQKTNVALKSADVRRALAMAVDRQSLISKALLGIGRPVFSPILPGQPGYSDAVHRIVFSVEQANALLDQAGWKRGESGVRAKGSQELAFSLTTVDDPSYVRLTQALATAWQAIGAKVEVKTVPADRMQKDVIKPRQYDALVFGQISNTDADPYPLWHSTQQRDAGFALAIVYLKNVDADLEKARTTTDPNIHQAALVDFQNIIADEVPAIILTQAEYVYAHPRSLRGFPTDRLVAGSDHFSSISSWYLKTRLSWK